MTHSAQATTPPAVDLHDRERRRARRRRVLLRGTIITDRGVTLSCSIQNISEHGCRLKFAVPPLLPETFVLRFNRTGETRACQLVWLSDREVGVRFTDVEAPAV